MAVLLSGLLLFADRLGAAGLSAASLVALLCGGVAYAAVVGHRASMWDPAGLFLAVALVFHLGLLVFPAFGQTAIFVFAADSSWFNDSSTVTAAVLVAIAAVSFACGVCLVRLISARTGRGDESTQPQPDVHRRRAFASAGFTLTVFAVAGWYVLSALSGGPFFFLGSYQGFLASTSGLPLPAAYYGLSLGVVLVAASGDAKTVRRTAAVFMVFAALALPLGLRGEVMFPVVAAAALLARWRSMPRKSMVVLMIVVLLTGIGLIKQVRQAGLGEVGSVTLSATPLGGLAELGYTLRTVSVAVVWHDVNGEPLRGGDTYAAPVDRAVRSAILGEDITPARLDDRLMNVEIADREGPIGGSFIAEAQHNFGRAGAVFVPFLMGALLACASIRQRSIVGDALMGVLLLAALQHVRNSFTPVPSQLVLGTVTVCVVAVAAWVARTTSDRRAAVRNR